MSDDASMSEAEERAAAEVNRRMQTVQKRMRQAFFRAFGIPKRSDNSPAAEAKADLAIQMLVVLHAGELVETAARFGDPALSLRDRVMVIVDAFIESNLGPIAEIVGDKDKFAYLMGAPKREGSATQ